MSWLARSIAATLSSSQGDSDDESDHASGEKTPEQPSSHGLNPNAEEPEQPDTPNRGVKDDISELTETLTRRFWGVASFLAPPPEASPPTAEAAAVVDEEEEEEEGERVQSPRIDGIRSDLAEIGGRVRSGISMLSNAKAVAEISKIASSFLPFGPGEADEEEVVPGLTEEVLVFVRHVSMQPETWLDFPLFVSERYADDFELSEAQYGHALAIERLVPSFSALRTELCSTDMSEACFWKIYFVLLHSKLKKQDAELLSTPQILEAREELLQSFQAGNRKGSEGPRESLEKANVSSAPAVEKEISPSSIQNKAGISEASSFEEPTSDLMPDVEAEKFTISTTEVEIIDKSVIEEELAVKNEREIVSTESKIRVEKDEDEEVEEWLEEDTGDVTGRTGNITSLEHEEDVSFSDLEDDDDDEGTGK